MQIFFLKKRHCQSSADMERPCCNNNSNNTDNGNDDDDNVCLIMTMIYHVALGVCVFWSYEI